MKSTIKFARVPSILALFAMAACGGGGSNDNRSPGSTAFPSTSPTPPARTDTAPPSTVTPKPAETSDPPGGGPPPSSELNTPTSIQAAMNGTGNGPPDVAVDANGNAIAVWEHSEAGAVRILSRPYVTGSGWGSVTPVSSPQSIQVGYPKIAFDSRGNALAVWLASEKPDSDIVQRLDVFIWASRYSADTGWGVPEAISQRGSWHIDDTSNRRDPLIVLDANGNATVVWYSWGSVNSVQYTSGVGWGPKKLIGGGGPGLLAMTPTIAGNANGDVVAMWWQPAAGMDELWSNRYTHALGWGAAAKVPSIATRVGSAPRMPPHVAMDGSGNVLALWIQGKADPLCTRINMWTARFSVEQGWDTAHILDGPPGECGSGNGSYTAASIAMDANGNALALWTKRDGVHTNSWWTRYSAGSGWIAPAILETYNMDWVIPHVIAKDSVGHNLAVLVGGNETNQTMWSKHYFANAGWKPSASIQGGLPYMTGFRIASNTKGKTVGVWLKTETSTSTSSIWASAF